MSKYGKIFMQEIVTLEKDLSSNDDIGLVSYIKTKHATAESKGRYVVRFIYANDSETGSVCVFVPKAVMDYKLIEPNSVISCSDTSCTVSIAGVDEYFERATNGQSLIHDGKQ